jgi:hypothetical protein
MQTIRFLFGLPSQAREAASSKVLGTFPIYDRYDYDDYSYHFQYDPYGIRLQMLTTMSAEEVRQLGHEAYLPLAATAANGLELAQRVGSHESATDLPCE